MSLPATDLSYDLPGVGTFLLALDAEPDALARLDALRRALHLLTGETERTVALARDAGATWERVADALALKSKQAAQQRYGASSWSS